MNLNILFFKKPILILILFCFVVYGSSEPSYYGNRAACYLAMEKYQLCISDCNRALDIDPNFTKVLRRKALS